MTLEEALAASEAEPVNDIFLINPETRTITVPETEKIFGVLHDGNTERKHFRCPKVVGDNIDLSTMRLYINYQNANGDKYPYLVEDVQTDGDYITFSWLIGPDVVAYKWQVKFIVCAKNGDRAIPEWNTTLAEGTVLEGLEATDEVVNRNPDIITQLLDRMREVEKIATKEEMQEYVNTYLTEHPGEIDETLTDPKKAAPADVVGSLKEDLTDISEERNFIPIDVIFRDNVGKFIVHNGGIGTNALYSISNLIPVELGNTKIRITFKKVNPYISRIAFLRKNVLSVENVISTFVQGSIGTFDVKIPSDAKYIAINSDTDAKGSTENEYPKVRFFPPLVNVDELDRNVKRIDKEVQDISKKLTDGNEIFRPTLNIGSTLYAIVGDTMQIFKDSIVDSFGNNYICKFECVKGRQYPRYWEYTPTASDIGETTLKISLVNASGNVIDEKTVSLITKQASNTKKNVLNIGDSTMANGEIPIELSRRLKGTNGVASTPSPLSLSNINVVGRLKNTDNSVGWEGTGGWTYSTYISSGSKAVRFVVNNASAITVGDLIRIDATNTYGYYQFQVAEVNVSNGTGNIRAVFHTTAYTEDFASKVSTSGAIKNTSGSIVGQYTSCSVESYQPFWNSETNSFDITSYVRTYCGGSVDFVFILLGINSLYKMSPWSDTSNIMSQCKTLLRNIHTQLPSAKVLLSTNHLVSQNGGLGANYDCRTSFGQFDVSTINHLLFEMNKKYYTLENDSEFSGYVKVVNTHAQFDAENAFPSMEKNVNTRATKKESVGTNGVHPTNNGYWQIADAEFRALLAN